MRFKQFILLEDFTPEQAAERVLSNCQPFLSKANGKMLYRGLPLRALADFFSKHLVTKDRNPVDTRLSIHNAMDAAFKHLYGIAFRSDAVFCTGDSYQAKEYGSVCAIYPIGEFDYLWSTKIGDAYRFFDNGGFAHAFGKKEIEWFIDQDVRETDPTFHKKYAEAIYNFIVAGEGNYMLNAGLERALDHGPEIMIHCDAYYAIYLPSKNSILKPRFDASKSEKALEIIYGK